METQQNNASPPIPPPLTAQVPQPTKKWYQHKGLIAIIILAFLTAIVSWAYFNFAQPQNVEPLVINHKPSATPRPIPTSTELSEASTTEPTAQPTLQASYVPNQLKQLADLHLVKYRGGDPTSQVQYFEVESINVSGAKLIMASDGYCDGEGCTPGYYRFLQNGTIYSLLTKYSAPVDGSLGLAKTDLNTSSTSNMDIPALDIPTQLQDPKTNAIIKLYTYSFTTGGLFNPQNKTLVFTANGYSVFSANTGPQAETYYVQAADGKELTYELSDSFIGNQSGGFTSTLDIKWNDEQIHNNNFQFDPAGNTDGGFDTCQEGQDYVKAVNSTTVSQNDLTAIGTNPSGQAIYGFKDLNNPILKAAQSQIAALGNKAHSNPADIVIFWKDPFGRLIRFVSSDMLDVCGGKPVIYLYPTKPTNVSVQVAPVGGISRSEPAYNNGWSVFAQPDGTLSSNGIQYPYLFWEGGLGSYKIPEDGFVVAKTDVKQLLNEKLSFVGLNSTEINDFEQFWLPKMQSAPFYFLTFTTNQDMEKYAPLNINPKPDTIIRVLMDYKPLLNYQSVAPLKLQSTTRQGFTVVEWGGALK